MLTQDEALNLADDVCMLPRGFTVYWLVHRAVLTRLIKAHHVRVLW